jgi:hypothetical protein
VQCKPEIAQQAAKGKHAGNSTDVVQTKWWFITAGMRWYWCCANYLRLQKT